MAANPERPVFFIGDWRVSPGEGLLSRGKEVVHLEPKVADVLTYLAAHPHEVVTRDELEKAVWHGALVGYDAVTATVIKLRRAMRDSAREPRYISTIPKRGYELIAPVRYAGAEQAPYNVPDADPPEDRQRWGVWSRNPRITLGLMVIAVALVAIGVWTLAPGRPHPVEAGTPVRPTIIVLPFRNLSGQPDQDYLADGMTEDLVTDLSRTSQLRVLANNTSMRYRGTNVSLEDIRRDLHVDYVLRGNMRSVGDAIRVNAQLVDVRTGFNAWGETYDRATEQVFAVQHEITGGVVDALAVTLSGPEKQRLARKATSNLKAYDSFQEGQRLAKVRQREANQQAEQAYRKAIEIDPTYGRAYGALAVTLAVDFRRGWTDSPTETLDHALEIARQAVALDHTIPQTYWALGFVHMMRKENDKAEEAMARALEIAPNYADAYGLLALIANNRSDGKHALVLARKGMRLNPFYSWDYPYQLGRAYYSLGRYATAVKELEEVRERNPTPLLPNLFLIASYIRVGRREDAQWLAEELAVTSPSVTLAMLARTSSIESPKLLARLLGDLRKAGVQE